MKLVFCMWWRVNRNNKFFRSFRVGMVRHAQSDLKKQFRINLVVKLIFCMWIGVHKYIYLIQLIYMGVVKHTQTFQK